MNTNTYIRLALTVSVAVLASGCFSSFRRAKPLSFSEIPYVSLDGKAWPQRYAVLQKMPRQYKMKAPVKISYVELNPDGGQTVVFIHGLGSYLKFWRYQLDAFAKLGYRVIAVDLPGYGKSEKPASFPYTMEAMADSVRELLLMLRIERPVLVGHSMGGQTALSYAIRYPKEPRAVVLVSPAGFEEFSKKEQAWFQKVVTAELIKSVPVYGIWGSVRYNNFYRWKRDYEWLVEERVRLAKSKKEFDRYAYANVRSIAGLGKNNFVRESAEKIVAPTLIVYGDKDRLIPNPFMHGGFTSWVMKRGHQKIKASELLGLARCGHTLQIDCHDELNTAAQRFLAKHAPPIASSKQPPPRKETAPVKRPPPGKKPASTPASQPAASSPAPLGKAKP
jgi:pimeloyl-ACP methyl ester carboxylesterase